jgi:hypothetical protein
LQFVSMAHRSSVDRHLPLFPFTVMQWLVKRAARSLAKCRGTTVVRPWRAVGQCFSEGAPCISLPLHRKCDIRASQLHGSFHSCVNADV